MRLFGKDVSTVTQNVILGSITGIAVGYNLRLLFMRYGSFEIVWVLFFLLGPALGYLSGRERQRVERLKNENQDLEKDLSKIRSALSLSTKKYKILVEQATDAIFLTTASGQFVLFNEATSLISGYDKKVLKNMSLEQVRVSEDSNKKPNEWLDNGIHCYEDVWRTRAGQDVTLEIRAKEIYMSDNHLVLHVARGIDNRHSIEDRNQGLSARNLHELLLKENAQGFKMLNKQVLNPIRAAMQIVESMDPLTLSQYPALENQKGKWAKTEKLIEGLLAKNQRDLETLPSKWNLNDIIMEELYTLRMVRAAKNIAVKVMLSSRNVSVFGLGRDFSIALGTMLKGIYTVLEAQEKAELEIKTKWFEENVLIEFKGFPVQTIDDGMDTAIHLNNAKPEEYEVSQNTWKGVYETFLEPFGGSFDISEAEEKVIVRVRIPVLETPVEKAPVLTTNEEEDAPVL